MPVWRPDCYTALHGGQVYGPHDPHPFLRHGGLSAEPAVCRGCGELEAAALALFDAAEATRHHSQIGARIEADPATVRGLMLVLLPDLDDMADPAVPIDHLFGLPIKPVPGQDVHQWLIRDERGVIAEGEVPNDH